MYGKRINILPSLILSPLSSLLTPFALSSFQLLQYVISCFSLFSFPVRLIYGGSSLKFRGFSLKDFIFNCGGLSVAFIFVTNWDSNNVAPIFNRLIGSVVLESFLMVVGYNV